MSAVLRNLVAPLLPPWRAGLPRGRVRNLSAVRAWLAHVRVLLGGRPACRRHDQQRSGASELAAHRFLAPLAALLLLALGPSLFAPSARAGDDAPPPPAPELIQRAEKIVAALKLADPDQATRVRDLVAGQYAALRVVHQSRDTGLKLAGEMADKTEAEHARTRARDAATARQNHLHYAFLAALAAELTPAQVEQIKDGMTYGVLPNTYRVYQEMVPTLTPAQKRQILAWLTEAREHAMDASSSEEKHGWFGKYKGRINNYLAKAGIDLKQAEKDMAARKKGAAGN
jgi:hypothetical protein